MPESESTQGHQPPDGALKASAAYADAVLASKRSLDEADRVLTDLSQRRDPDPEDEAASMRYANARAALGIGYARLASALQKAPGQR